MPLAPDAGILPSKFNGVYFVMFNGAERVFVSRTMLRSKTLAHATR